MTYRSILNVGAALAASLALTQCTTTPGGDVAKGSDLAKTSPNQVRLLSQETQTVDGQECTVNRWVVTENPLETWSEILPVKKVTAPAGR
jgi:hypothetical protein